MDRDTEQLNLLAIFHYVVAGLAAFFSFFPLIYAAVGVIFIFAAQYGTAKPDEELPPEFLGWIFAVVGSLLFVIGVVMAICIFLAGRSLALRKRYSFALVIACVECLFVRLEQFSGFFRLSRFRASLSGHYSPSQVHKTRLKITLLTLAIGSPKRASPLNRATPPMPNLPGLVQFPVFGLPDCSISRRNWSPVALFTFKVPGSEAPSGTSTQRPPT